MRAFFSVGEPSGDLHAANLIAELRRRRPGVVCEGYGGPKMQAAGCQLHYPLADDPLMMFGKVFLQLPHYVRLLQNARQSWRKNRPDVVVLVDYPGFNWHVARAAKQMGIPVAYHLPPQIWSWASWRVRKMRRFVDHLFCSLPFEVPWYREHGIDFAEHHGHPFFDDLAERRLDPSFVDSLQERDRPILALLPGSRNMEVRRNIGLMAKSAAIIQSHQNCRVVVAAFRGEHSQPISEALNRHHCQAEIFVGRTPEIIASATAAIAVSGSVSLELMHHRIPAAIVYYAGPLLYHISGPLLVHTPFITLVNLLACKSVYPEFIGYRDASTEISGRVGEWLTDTPQRRDLVARLDRLCQCYGQPGATSAVAGRLLEIVEGPPSIRRAA